MSKGSERSEARPTGRPERVEDQRGSALDESRRPPRSASQDDACVSDQVIKGYCSCKATSWEIEGEPNWQCYCHCDDCRRNCAAPVVAWLGAWRKNFRWTGAEPRVWESSPGTHRYFCATCGTPIAFIAKHYQGKMALYAGTMEDPIWTGTGFVPRG